MHLKSFRERVECMEELLTVRQVAATTGLSEKQVYNAIEKGRLPAARFPNKARRVKRSVLAQWILEHEVALSQAG